MFTGINQYQSNTGADDANGPLTSEKTAQPNEWIPRSAPYCFTDGSNRQSLPRTTCRFEFSGHHLVKEVGGGPNPSLRVVKEH